MRGRVRPRGLRVDLVHGQEARPAGAELHEGGLERRVDRLHDSLVDVALELPAASRFDLDPVQNAVGNDGHTAFFRLENIDEHFLGHVSTIT